MRRRFKGASVDATEAGGEVAATEAGEGAERWTSGRKADVVLRLVRGEDVATVSREIGVPAHQLEEWRRVFVEGGKGHLRSRGEPDQERELTRARAKVGELMMELELAEGLLKKGFRGRPEEARAMKERVSAATNRRYPFTMICSVYRLARSSGYAAANGRDADAVSVKPGPRPEVSDESLLQLIRSEIETCPFVGEGHRKVHCRLNKRGIVMGRGRVLRLMRQDRLLVPQRTRRVHGNAAHDGTIVTERSNHRRRAEAAAGLGRSIHIPLFEGETRWLGIELSHPFVAEPQCNGVAERFMRTVKEECLWLFDFEDLEQARARIAAFIDLYNHEWLIERLGYRTPAVAHRELLQEAA